MSANTTDPGYRSPEQIETEVEATRARLSGKLDELRERSSPSKIVEQAMDYVQSSGGNEFVRNIGRSVRDNPLPVLMIGAGIGWLMMSGGEPRTRRYETRRSGYGMPDYGGADDSRYGTAYDRDPSYGSGDASYGSAYDRTPAYGSDTIYGSHPAGGSSQTGSDDKDGLRDRVAENYGAARDRIGEGANAAYETAANAADRVAQTARYGADRLARTGDRVAGQVGEWSRDARRGAMMARERVEDMMHEHPLLLGALGLTLGAAVGALVPATEAENRLMGKTRDDLLEEGKIRAREASEQVVETVQDEIEQAKAKLDKDGLSPSSIASSVSEAVKSAADRLTGEAQRATGGGSGSSTTGTTSATGTAGSTSGIPGGTASGMPKGKGTSPTT